jgi:hypothetical protein
MRFSFHRAGPGSFGKTALRTRTGQATIPSVFGTHRGLIAHVVVCQRSLREPRYRTVVATVIVYPHWFSTGI